MKRFFYNFFLLLFLFNSCNSDVIVDISTDALATGKVFRVEFDEITWDAELEDVTVKMFSGKTKITAKKGGQIFTLTLLNDQVGEYQVSLSDSNGNIVYVPGTGEEAFTTEFQDAIGIINLTKIDLESRLLSGTFSFTGKRNVAEVEEVKEFTRGKFEDLPFPFNGFFAKIDGFEFETETIFAVKADGNITITATKGIESISIVLPDDVTTDTTLSVNSSPSVAFFASYFNGINTFFTEPGLGSSENKLRVVKHDETNRIIEGTFEFNINNATETRIESGDNLKDETRKFVIKYTG